LDDVTPRQRLALADADVIACEDSRRIGKLLEHLEIDRRNRNPRLIPYHDHNERTAADRLERTLERGRRVVLVSDAGTPGISDPGFELIRRATELGLEVTSLPGPVAAMVALTGSGLPMHDFQFRGFPPGSETARRQFLEEIDRPGLTTLMYESPNRLRQLLDAVVDVYGEERQICVARELTKMHEEYLRGTAGDVRSTLRDRDEVRGECVVVVGPGAGADENGGVTEREVDQKILELLDRNFSPRTIKEIVSELYEVSRSDLYDRIHGLQQDD
jgi:16S rRNA (cytidine1402-2'-O)-methyltransferase